MESYLHRLRERGGAMRNLFILVATLAGAWFMGQWALALGGTLAVGSAEISPLGGLLMAPAVLTGALAGALLGGLLYPRAR